MKNRILTITFSAAMVLISSGCADQNRVAADYGTSVHQMIEQQIYDMNAASSPDPNAVLGGDPDRLNNTLDGHRKDVAKPEGVAAPVNITIGNSAQ